MSNSDVKVRIVGHDGPLCERCNAPTTTFVVHEDIPPDFVAGDMGCYCPTCIKEELSDG